MTNIVYLEDCIEGMKRFSDGYFDLAIVDQPYGFEIDEDYFKAQEKRFNDFKSQLTLF